MTPHLNRLVKTVQKKVPNICFYAELTKLSLIINKYSLLSRALERERFHNHLRCMGTLSGEASLQFNLRVNFQRKDPMTHFYLSRINPILERKRKQTASHKRCPLNPIALRKTKFPKLNAILVFVSECNRFNVKMVE